MASWDSADLLQRCKDEFGRPDVDAAFPDARIYRYLTAAEAHWKPVLAAHYPNDMFGDPTILTAVAGGATFTLPASEEDPLAIMILSSATGHPLKPGAYWDAQSDYVLEKGQIRMTRGRTDVTFTDGAPYCRQVTGPADIDASTDSTMFPKRLRVLLVYHACAAMARSGMGLGDPSFYQEAADEAAWGNALTGDLGQIGALKARDEFGGMEAVAGGGTYAFWRPNG